MTIIYQYKVATTSVCGFFKLLGRWRGSVYKLMFKETLIFCGMYTAISLVYRFALTAQQRGVFEKIAQYCNNYTSLIPVSFVLGFYVSLVVHRWWQQFSNVPWPDRTLFIMGSYLTGQDERARIIRRTVARYMMFGLILILRSISVAVMKRFPTLEHIVDAGFITQDEALDYERVCCKYNKFWVPLVWANSVLTQARREGRIDSDIGFRLIMEQLADFRDKCSLCFVYDWITIPLVYTQVVTLSVHTFFAACLIGRQYVENEDDHPDLYVPVFTLLQFFFYMGWLKVAEQLINPFGEDDDDFDMNWLLDRHAAVVMCLVDQCHGVHPSLVKDVHFNEIVQDLPYTEASRASRRPNFLGSTYNLARPSVAEQRIIQPVNMADIPVPGRRGRSYTSPRPGSSGSMWSLFGFKSNLLQRSGSGDTMMSSSTMANGHAGFGPSNIMGHQVPGQVFHHPRSSTGSEVNHQSNPEYPPEYVPLRRARASTDADHKPLRRLINSDRERKWSFPLSLLRKKQNREMLDRGSMASMSSITSDGPIGGEASPLLTSSQMHGQHPQLQRTGGRFTVEAVANDPEIDSSKATRNKMILDKHMGHMGLSVSRPPVLSAIEEGNTIRSIKDIVPSPTTLSLETMEENVGSIPEESVPNTISEEHEDDVFFDDIRESDGEESDGSRKELLGDASPELDEPTDKESLILTPDKDVPEIQIEEA